MSCSMPGFPVLHYLPEFAQTHVQGWNPCPLQWNHRVLTTGPPGKSKILLLIKENQTTQVKQFSVEIIPFLCISAVWSQDLVLSCPESSQGSPSGQTAVADGLMATASFVCWYGRQHFTSITAASIIIMKVWNTVRITRLWHRDRKWAKAAGKMALIDFCWVSQTFSL